MVMSSLSHRAIHGVLTFALSTGFASALELDQSAVTFKLPEQIEWKDPVESVRRLQAGLQSFLSMRRIEARRKNASALRLRFSQSLASLRQRLSQAMVRSTIQRLGKTTNPTDPIGAFDDFNVEMRENFCQRCWQIAVLDIRRRRRASSKRETSRTRSP